MGHKFKSLFVLARKFFDILPLISVIIDCRAFRYRVFGLRVLRLKDTV